MVSFDIFVKSMQPSLLELKVTPSFCFPFKIPDDPTATINYLPYWLWGDNLKWRRQVWHFHRGRLEGKLPLHPPTFDKGSWRTPVPEAPSDTL